MNRFLLKFLIGGTALTLAGCAAVFSIIGLSKLFAGAAIGVIIMASTLEFSKIVITTYLHNYWSTTGKVLRGYLIFAVSIIAVITSMGIYGYLSSAYETTKGSYDIAQTAVDSLEMKKAYYTIALKGVDRQIELKQKQLDSKTAIRINQESRLDSLVAKGRSTYQIRKQIESIEDQISSTQPQVDSLNRVSIQYSDSISRIGVEVLQTDISVNQDSELGSLQFIARVLNVTMDTIVNALIILFMLVFDPLAITLVVVFNKMNKKEQKTAEADQEPEEKKLHSKEKSSILEYQNPSDVVYKRPIR